MKTKSRLPSAVYGLRLKTADRGLSSFWLLKSRSDSVTQQRHLRLYGIQNGRIIGVDVSISSKSAFGFAGGSFGHDLPMLAGSFTIPTSVALMTLSH
jgi:hypothetical protein